MHTVPIFHRAAVAETPASEMATYPLLGIGSVVVGTLAAISFIPDDPAPKYALFNSGLAMAIGLAIGPLAAAIREPKAILLGQHLVILAPIYWLLLDILQGAYELEGIDRSQVEMSFMAIGVFAGAVWISTYFRFGKLPNFILESAARELPATALFGISAGAFALAMFKFAYPCNFDLSAMLYYLGQNRWAAPWGRGQLGGWDAFTDHLQYFGYGLPALTVMIANKARWSNWRSLASVAMSAVFVAFMAQSGGRRIIGVMIGMALILWTLTQKRLNAQKMLAIALAIGLLFALMQVMLSVRGVGLAGVLESEDTGTLLSSDHLHVDDNFLRLAQITGFIPAYYPYVGFHYVSWVLVRPIPRVFWPGKPVDPGFDLTSAVGMKGISLSCSIIGELYMSWGLLAVAIGGFLLGQLAGMGNGLLVSKAGSGRLFIYSALMMSLFAGMRSMLDLVLMSYVILAWVFLMKAYALFKRS